MNLESQLTALKKHSDELTLAKRAQLSCGLAKQLEKAGEYEKACEALEEFWPEHNAPPKLEGLDREMTAQVLLRVGALAGWLGSTHQAGGSQESAKDLINQSLRIFERLGQPEKVAEAQSDLALCYWREGGFDEARIHLTRAFEILKNGNTDMRACVLIRSGLVERTAGFLNDARRLYEQSAPLVDQSMDHALKGTFHNGFAATLQHLADAENRQDYRDQALIEYAAASIHFEQAGHTRYQGCVDINVGFLLSIVGRFAEAHKYLNRARDVFIAIGDSVHLAQVNDTRARAMLGEGRLAEAERYARSAVKTLDKGDEQALLAEALTTHGVALARTGKEPGAFLQLQRAIEVAETAGDLEGAGRAKLSIIEELGDKLSIEELTSIYRSATELLKSSQAPSTTKRLISCAAKLLAVIERLELKPKVELEELTWEGFSLKQYLRADERTVIERALRDARGSVTRAARLLGFRHHQSLISLINSRHKELLKSRSTVRTRRRHLFSKPKKSKTKDVSTDSGASQISILHVEDNELVARTVSDVLTNEGMRVDSCIDGSTAVKILKGNARYDAIIVDNSLPGLTGLEIIKRVQGMAHRRATPIMMLSADDVEREAWRAGVDEFLRKPEAIDQVSSTIKRLIKRKDKMK